MGRARRSCWASLDSTLELKPDHIAVAGIFVRTALNRRLLPQRLLGDSLYSAALAWHRRATGFHSGLRPELGTSLPSAGTRAEGSRANVLRYGFLHEMARRGEPNTFHKLQGTDENCSCRFGAVGAGSGAAWPTG